MCKKLLIIVAILLVGCLGLTVYETFNQNQSLLPLTEKELSIYQLYIKNHDDKVLADSNPLLICKLYLYAAKLHDADTCYALLSKDKEYNYLLPTKEEFLANYMFFEGENSWDFSKVKNLSVSFDEDKIHAQVEWSSYVKNKSTNKKQEIEFTFFLIKNNLNIWKVSYQPLEVK